MTTAAYSLTQTLSDVNLNARGFKAEINMPNPPIVSRDTPVDFPNYKKKKALAISSKGVFSIAVDLLVAKGKWEIRERIFKFHGVNPSNRYDSKSPM